MAAKSNPEPAPVDPAGVDIPGAMPAAVDRLLQIGARRRDALGLSEPAPVEVVEPEWGNWRYTGPAGHIYTNIPLTAEPGDVIAWLGSPGVGWELTDAEVNVLADNHRDELPAYVDNEPVPPAGV